MVAESANPTAGLELEEIFEVDRLIFIPVQPHDFTGHADGMARFLNDETVIANGYKDENPEFRRAFIVALNNAGLDYVEIPNNMNVNRNYNQPMAVISTLFRWKI